MGLAVEYAAALLDGCLADGLSQVAFAGAGRPKKQSTFMASDESASGEMFLGQILVEFGLSAEVWQLEGRIVEMLLWYRLAVTEVHTTARWGA